MSAALFERAAGARHEAESAGTNPAERVHPPLAEVRRIRDDIAKRVQALVSALG